MLTAEAPPVQSEKQKGAAFNALARQRIIYARRVGKGGMDGKAIPPVESRVIGLDQRNLIGGHTREVTPAMRRIEMGHLYLTDAILGLARDRDDIVRAECGAATKGQWHGFHRSGDGSPDIDDSKVSRHQRRCLIGQDFSQALFGRPCGLVILDHCRGLAHFLLAAHAVAGGAARMIKHMHPPRTGMRCQQRFQFCIISRRQHLIIMKVDDRSLVGSQRKALPVKG